MGIPSICHLRPSNFHGTNTTNYQLWGYTILRQNHFLEFFLSPKSIFFGIGSNHPTEHVMWTMQIEDWCHFLPTTSQVTCTTMEMGNNIPFPYISHIFPINHHFSHIFPIYFPWNDPTNHKGRPDVAPSCGPWIQRGTRRDASPKVQLGKVGLLSNATRAGSPLEFTGWVDDVDGCGTSGPVFQPGVAGWDMVSMVNLWNWISWISMWKVLQWLAKVPKDQGDSIVKIDEICSGWQVIVICKSAVFAKRPLLVGGLAHLDCFSICWEFHHPNWFSYFSEVLEPPTRLRRLWYLKIADALNS